MSLVILRAAWSQFNVICCSALYAWSVLPSNSRLMKRAVDNVLAALCHLEPTFFHALLQKFFRSELAMATETAILRASVTDDDKDDVQQGRSAGPAGHYLLSVHLFKILLPYMFLMADMP